MYVDCKPYRGYFFLARISTRRTGSNYASSSAFGTAYHLYTEKIVILQFSAFEVTSTELPGYKELTKGTPYSDLSQSYQILLRIILVMKANGL